MDPDEEASFQEDDYNGENVYRSISFDPAILQRPPSIHSIRSMKRAESFSLQHDHAGIVIEEERDAESSVISSSSQDTPKYPLFSVGAIEQDIPETKQTSDLSAGEIKELADEYKKTNKIEESSEDISEHGGCIECVKAIPIISGEEIEEGDHIVFAGAVYDHHGIVVSRKGDGNEIEIVEATNSISGATAGILFGGKAKVQRNVKTFNFITDNIRVVVYRKPRFSKKEIACRAMRFISGVDPNRKNFDYHLLANNCEHFATFCVTGKRFSIQVRKFVMIASIFVRRGFRGISDENLRNEKEYENNIICKQCYEVNKKLVSAKVTPIWSRGDVHLGDVIRYSYWNLWHDAVVLRIIKKESKFVLSEIAHYCFHGPFSHREIIREELKIDFIYVSVVHYEAPDHDVYDPEDVVRRAKQRVGEKCFVFFSNDSSHYARWCKLKLIRQTMGTAV